MSDPTTAETPTMLDRVCAAYHEAVGLDLSEGSWWSNPENAKEGDRTHMRQAVREMLEPSDGFIDAMMRGFHPGEEPRQAMRDALVNGVYSILNETKD